ncbi:MAG: SpoIIE family protein phosphatase [bacterium]
MFIEYAVRQLNKKGEELCGDNIEITKSPSSKIFVLSDGLGSGVKASILSTLTKKIAATMLMHGMPIEEVVETIISTLPVCKVRNIAYSTFSILQIFDDFEAKLVEFDTPDTLLFHNNEFVDYSYENLKISDKKIKISRFKLFDGDFLVILSDGIMHAGLGTLLPLGWKKEHIADFVTRNLNEETDSRILADKLIETAQNLYNGEIGDDATVLIIKTRKKNSLVVAIGPPVDKAKDNELVNTVLKFDGKKIICGGTTANIFAKCMNHEIKVDIEKNEENIPPKATIKGINLVTEGVITLAKTKEILEQDIIKSDNPALLTYKEPKNPSQELVNAFYKADSIKFLVGTAVNSIYTGYDFPLESKLKIKLVLDIAEKLTKLCKEVEIEYF